MQRIAQGLQAVLRNSIAPACAAETALSQTAPVHQLHSLAARAWQRAAQQAAHACVQPSKVVACRNERCSEPCCIRFSNDTN